MQSSGLSQLLQIKQAAPGNPLAFENLLAQLRPDFAATVQAKNPETGSGRENDFASGAQGSTMQSWDTPGENSSSPQAEGDPAARYSQREGGSGPHTGKPAGKEQSGNPTGASEQQPASAPQSGNNSLSLAQKLKQAFNGLMAALNPNSSSPGQNTGDPASAKDQDSAKSSGENGKSSNSAQNSANQSPSYTGNEDAPAAGSQIMTAKGTGLQSGPPPLTTGTPGETPLGNPAPAPPQAHTTPEVVPLQAVPFKGKAMLQAELENGKAMVPYRNSVFAGNTSIEGAEHGAPPLRYRTYVRRYFDHSKDPQAFSSAKGN